MRGRASHLRTLLSRALSPSLPPPGRALPQVLGGSPPSSFERWISARPCGSGAEMFGAGFLGRARFFASDASAATQGGSKPPAPPPAGSAGGEGGGGGQSGKSEQADAGKAVRGGPVSWLSFLLLLVTGGGIIVYYDKEKKRHIEELKNRTSAVKPGQSVGTAAIGGPFKLLNHDGKPVTEKDFMGKWTLFYFGFTHCPDICPDELQKMAAAIDKIKEKAKLDVVPVFITVDPERDTVEQVRDYVKEFHPDLIGLTGTTDEVRQVARAYRVYYMKTEEEGSDYLVDHSIVMYLMNPEMKFVKFYGKNYDTDSLADGIIKEIKEHK
ncbi:protein SCO1 homolog 1, mitochondrial-like [Miscanthus floridulus]